MIKRPNMIGPISKYKYLKIKLMNMVTKNLEQNTYSDHSLKTNFICNSQFMSETSFSMKEKMNWSPNVFEEIFYRNFVVKKWGIGLPLNIK